MILRVMTSKYFEFSFCSAYYIIHFIMIFESRFQIKYAFWNTFLWILIGRKWMIYIYIKEKLFKLFFQRSSISLFIRKCVDTKYNILRLTKKNYIEIDLRYSRSTVILLSCNKNMWVEHGTIVIYPKLICFKLFAQSLKYFNNFLLLTLETLLYSWSFCLTILFRCCIIYIFHISKPLMYICSIQV